jgi:hypothetical protein
METVTMSYEELDRVSVIERVIEEGDGSVRRTRAGANGAVSGIARKGREGEGPIGAPRSSIERGFRRAGWRPV